MEEKRNVKKKKEIQTLKERTGQREKLRCPVCHSERFRDIAYIGSTALPLKQCLKCGNVWMEV